MPDTFEAMERLRRDAELLLRELEGVLAKAYMAFNSPVSAARRLDSKFTALYRKMDAEVRLASPPVREAYTKIRQHVESERKRMERQAQTAFTALPRNTGLAGFYNNTVGDAFSQIPGGGTRAVAQQIDNLVEKMVNGVVTDSSIPGHVKTQMARSLADWIKQQDATQDALYVVQNALVGVAGWLHEKLTIQRQIEDTRKNVKGRGQLTSEEAAQADQSVGALAQRSQQLDKEIEQQLTRSITRINPYLRLNPRLVLDPAKAFLDSIEVRAGIRMQPNGVRVDLGVGVKVIDPFSPDRVVINPALQIVPQNGMKIGLSGESTYEVNDQRWNHTVKATLSWSF